MDGRLGATTGTPIVPGLTVLDPVPADAAVIAVRASRDADGVPVWLHLARGELNDPLRLALRTGIPELVATLADLHGVPLLAVLAHGMVPGASYLVTPRPGPTLEDDLSSIPLPTPAVITAMHCIADALVALHGHGVLHRGLSPAAVYRTADGSWVLSPPLPVAMAEASGGRDDAGAYEPPEVLAGGEWTPAGEVYALAATMWAALAGRPPYGAADRLSRLVGAEPHPIARLDVPPALLDTLRAGMARLPDQRPKLSAFVSERLDTLPPVRHIAETRARPLGSRYLLDELIGRGATGHVWRGHTRDGSRTVAVKLLRTELAEDPDVVTRFMRERATLTRLSHPHLVSVYDLVAEGDALAIVMDLVDGVDLRRLAAKGRIDSSTAADLLAQTADALAAVHAAGIVHRDLKPENVLVETRDGNPYALLTDFGLARATESATITRFTQLVGTPAYVAPELIAGREPGPAVDVYALGVTGYELLAGHRPFPDSGTPALLRAHLEVAPPRPEGVTGPVWALLAACLAKDPECRPDAAQVAEAWRRLSSDMLAPLPFEIRSARPPAPPTGPANVTLDTIGARRPVAPAPPPPRLAVSVPGLSVAGPSVAGRSGGGPSVAGRSVAGPSVSALSMPAQLPPAPRPTSVVLGPPPASVVVAPPPPPAVAGNDWFTQVAQPARPSYPAPAARKAPARPARPGGPTGPLLGRRARWPWYALAAVVIVGGFIVGIVLGKDKPKHAAAPTSSVSSNLQPYPIAAKITQQPGGLPILKWDEDPNLFTTDSYVLVVQGGGQTVRVPFPTHSLVLTNSEPGKAICLSVFGIRLKSLPQPPPDIKPVCITPQGGSS